MCAAVDDLWWRVWWPWALTWAATLALLVAAGWLLARRWRSRRRLRQPHPGVSFYLNGEAVMDLYQGTHHRALRQEVEEVIQSTKNATLTTALYGVSGGAGRSVDSKVFRKYVETAEPVAVVRIIMEVLEKADDILYVDLPDGAIEPGRSLSRALRSPEGGITAAVTFEELSDFWVYVSVRGRFHQSAKTADTVTFEAPCTPANATAVVTCLSSGIRPTSLPPGTFPARCLGRIQSWDPATRRLDVDPIAIFR